jgi:hypothetical protein
VTVGVCDIETALELDIEDDPEGFATEIQKAFEEGDLMVWYQDIKGRKIGIPVQKIAFVAIETEETPLSVGFA